MDGAVLKVLRTLPWLALPFCAGPGLSAQAVNDLNSLVLQAEHFAGHVMAEQGRSHPMELFKITGRSLGPPEDLMHEAADIQNWTLIYQVAERPSVAEANPLSAASLSAAPLSAAPVPPPVPPTFPIRSAYLRCERGAFANLDWSPVPVMDCYSLAWRWFTIPVEEAVHRLRASGFDRGFSQVTLMRPMHPSYPDQSTYVFNCPTETANVGISAQTGELLWSEVWNPTKGSGN